MRKVPSTTSSLLKIESWMEPLLQYETKVGTTLLSQLCKGSLSAEDFRQALAYFSEESSLPAGNPHDKIKFFNKNLHIKRMQTFVRSALACLSPFEISHTTLTTFITDLMTLEVEILGKEISETEPTRLSETFIYECYQWLYDRSQTSKEPLIKFHESMSAEFFKKFKLETYDTHLSADVRYYLNQYFSKASVTQPEPYESNLSAGDSSVELEQKTESSVFDQLTQRFERLTAQRNSSDPNEIDPQEEVILNLFFSENFTKKAKAESGAKTQRLIDCLISGDLESIDYEAFSCDDNFKQGSRCKTEQQNSAKHHFINILFECLIQDDSSFKKMHLFFKWMLDNECRLGKSFRGNTIGGNIFVKFFHCIFEVSPEHSEKLMVDYLTYFFVKINRDTEKEIRRSTAFHLDRMFRSPLLTGDGGKSARYLYNRRAHIADEIIARFKDPEIKQDQPTAERSLAQWELVQKPPTSQVKSLQFSTPRTILEEPEVDQPTQQQDQSDRVSYQTTHLRGFDSALADSVTSMLFSRRFTPSSNKLRLIDCLCDPSSLSHINFLDLMDHVFSNPKTADLFANHVFDLLIRGSNPPSSLAVAKLTEELIEQAPNIIKLSSSKSFIKPFIRNCLTHLKSSPELFISTTAYLLFQQRQNESTLAKLEIESVLDDLCSTLKLDKAIITPEIQAHILAKVEILEFHIQKISPSLIIDKAKEKIALIEKIEEQLKSSFTHVVESKSKASLLSRLFNRGKSENIQLNRAAHLTRLRSMLIESNVTQGIHEIFSEFAKVNPEGYQLLTQPSKAGELSIERTLKNAVIEWKTAKKQQPQLVRSSNEPSSNNPPSSNNGAGYWSKYQLPEASGTDEKSGDVHFKIEGNIFLFGTNNHSKTKSGHPTAEQQEMSAASQQPKP